MRSIASIKNGIENLYQTNPNVHVTVYKTRPKVAVLNHPAVIKAVYNHVFQLEECIDGVVRRYTVQYADVYTSQIEISELKS